MSNNEAVVTAVEMGGIVFVKNIQLSVVSIKVKVNTIFPIYVTDLKHVNYE